MPLKTKRWTDPVDAADGTRILVTRYRPRGVRKEQENWSEWLKQLAPSENLHADAYGHNESQVKIEWDEYRTRYLTEMGRQRVLIGQLAARVLAGETITLLCSSACEDPERCHRLLLKDLVEERLPRHLRTPHEQKKDILGIKKEDGSTTSPEGVDKLRKWLS